MIMDRVVVKIRVRETVRVNTTQNLTLNSNHQIRQLK